MSPVQTETAEAFRPNGIAPDITGGLAGLAAKYGPAKADPQPGSAAKARAKRATKHEMHVLRRELRLLVRAYRPADVRAALNAAAVHLLVKKFAPPAAVLRMKRVVDREARFLIGG
jgi:hypothetical protein